MTRMGPGGGVLVEEKDVVQAGEEKLQEKCHGFLLHRHFYSH